MDTGELTGGFVTSIGEIIRLRRRQAELPVRTLASMVGISGPYLSQIERGLRAPSDHVLRAIATSLRTTADVLRNEAGPDWDPPPAVLSAIAEDPRLTPRQRRALGDVYRAFVAQNTPERPGD